MSEEQISMRDLLEVLVEDSTKIQQKFIELEEKINQRFDQVFDAFAIFNQRLDYHELWLKRIDKNLENCVTKSEFGQLANCFHDLISVLEKNQIISTYDAKQALYNNPTL